MNYEGAVCGGLGLSVPKSPKGTFRIDNRRPTGTIQTA